MMSGVEAVVVEKEELRLGVRVLELCEAVDEGGAAVVTVGSKMAEAGTV
jgi:hypothetical protein